MYRLPVCRVALVRKGTLTAEARTIHNPADAATIARAIIGDADREHVVALLLDVKHRVIAVHLVAVGALDHAQVHPREVFKCAILANAAALVLAHVHPSGDPEPSRADVEITRRLVQAGDLIGIRVLDHVVLGDRSHVSLAERGAIPRAGK